MIFKAILRQGAGFDQNHLVGLEILPDRRVDLLLRQRADSQREVVKPARAVTSIDGCHQGAGHAVAGCQINLEGADQTALSRFEFFF